MANDLLALQLASGELDRLPGKVRTPGDSGGVDHIGLAVDDPAVLTALVEAVCPHGGEILWVSDQNEIGTRSAFVRDPDGYVLQLG